MARIRTIKPEFFTSEQIMELRPLTRLLFIGLWPFCDDHGVHPASCKTLKAEVFPADDILLSEIEGMIMELISRRLIVEYSTTDRRYWHVTGWQAHQKIERPNYKHPFPYEQNQVVVYDSSIDRRPIDDQSTINRRALDDHSPPEWKGKESNGEEEKESSSSSSVPVKLPIRETEEEEAVRNETRLTMVEMGMLHQEAFGVLMPGGGRQLAHEICQQFDGEAIRQAYQAAAVQGKLTLAYVNGILRGNGNPARASPGRSENRRENERREAAQRILARLRDDEQRAENAGAVDAG